MNGKHNNQKEKHHPTKAEVRIGVLNGIILYTISDTRAASIAGLQADPLIITNRYSSKVLSPKSNDITGHQGRKLEHKVRETSRTIGMVPDLV